LRGQGRVLAAGAMNATDQGEAGGPKTGRGGGFVEEFKSQGNKKNIGAEDSRSGETGCQAQIGYTPPAAGLNVLASLKKKTRGGGERHLRKPLDGGKGENRVGHPLWGPGLGTTAVRNTDGDCRANQADRSDFNR